MSSARPPCALAAAVNRSRRSWLPRHCKHCAWHVMHVVWQCARGLRRGLRRVVIGSWRGSGVWCTGRGAQERARTRAFACACTCALRECRGFACSQAAPTHEPRSVGPCIRLRARQSIRPLAQPCCSLAAAPPIARAGPIEEGVGHRHGQRRRRQFQERCRAGRGPFHKLGICSAQDLASGEVVRQSQGQQGHVGLGPGYRCGIAVLRLARHPQQRGNDLWD
eukprot:2840899-Alexandrium_andersonii.AAC.1